MSNLYFIFFSMILYILILSILAYYFERKMDLGKNLINNPFIYSLSLSVYCTSWTYYGAVGSAVLQGGLFLAIYLGPMLSLILWEIVVKKYIVLKERHNFTSMIDLLTARYDKSIGLGILASLFLLIGVVPYMTLQLTAMIDTVTIMTDVTKNGSGVISHNFVGISIVTVMMISTIVLGLKRIKTSEQHPGMIFVLAIESIIKLLAISLVGIFALYTLNDGFDDLISKIPNLVDTNYTFMGHRGYEDIVVWLTYLLLSGSAFIFLPRQFHVAVIENYNWKHIRFACWAFPIYMLIICFFVFPIAIAGIKSGLSKEHADSFVLLLPIANNQKLLAYFVFLGGISAAAGMLLIEGMTISTVLSNHLFIPIINRFKILANIQNKIVFIRSTSLFILYVISFLFWKIFGHQKGLMALGMISFAAVLQFAPAMLGGIFWKKGSRTGAYLGISLGTLVWFYTLIIPLIAKNNFAFGWIMEEGPFGIAFLNPEALFNFSFFHPLTHATFWSLFLNISGFVIGSIIFPQNITEERIAEGFVETAENDENMSWEFEDETGKNVNLKDKIKTLEVILLSFFSKTRCNKIIKQCLQMTNIDDKEKISILKLSEFSINVEKQIASSIGTAAANAALKQNNFISESENDQLTDYYSKYLTKMKISPAKLNKSIELYREKEKIMIDEAKLLEDLVKRKTDELEIQKSKSINSSKLAALGEMAGGIAHEINNPLAVISGYVHLVDRMIDMNQLDHKMIKSSLDNIKMTVYRISKIINCMRNVSRDSSNEDFVISSLEEILEDSISLCREKFKNCGIELSLDIEESVYKFPIKLKRINMTQCFINLLNNSYDGVKDLNNKWVKISAFKRIDQMEIYFTDSGAGIPIEIKDKIFQPFFTTKDIGEGTGLGLSIVRKIIHEHNGSIEVDIENQNTSFLIIIPV